MLTGECLLVVEGEERTLGPWDYFHCPPGTRHITIGAGEQGCAILMVGTRVGERTHYPADAGRREARRRRRRVHRLRARGLPRPPADRARQRAVAAAGMTEVGRLAGLWRYPVKSMAAEPLDARRGRPRRARGRPPLGVRSAPGWSAATSRG